MSYRPERLNNYKERLSSNKTDILNGKSISDLKDLFLEILHDKIHGLCFSAYTENQKPGEILEYNTLETRIKQLTPFTKALRSFSCIEGNELIPQIAKKHGLKTFVGAWLGEDKDKNELEISGLIKLAKEGYVDIASVGNEVLYRGDLTEDELLNYIQRVKKEVPDIPVGYVDAYYEFADRPKLIGVSDVLLINCYPFWEGTNIDYSLDHMKSMYNMVKNVSNGKKIIISETGWPSQGNSLKNSHPSYENALRYFIDTQLWVMEENIESFYFSSFDEEWKVDSEGDVGAFWGIWDKNNNLKY